MNIIVTVNGQTPITVTSPEVMPVSVNPVGGVGPKGDDGAPGADGDDGIGVALGGVENQALIKQSSTDGDTDWEYLQDIYLVVENTSGGLLGKGTPVHITGENASGNPTVIAARADTPSAMPANFILAEAIADGVEGLAFLIGRIQGVNTSSFTAGDVVYVGATGGYTTTKPTGTNLIQNLGIVTSIDAVNGGGWIYGAGRSNDVPNLPAGKFFIGSASNTVESAYTLPTSDGTSNQVLKTNGAGVVSFQDDTDTTYTAGIGLTLSGTEFSVDYTGETNVVTQASDYSTQTLISTDDKIIVHNNDTDEVLEISVFDFFSGYGVLKYIDTAANTLTENSQTGTTYTTVLTDAGKMITCNNASPITVTIPANSSVAYDAGTVLSFIQKGAGQVTLAPDTGVTLNNANGLKTASQHSVISCWKEDTDTWVVYGDTTT